MRIENLDNVRVIIGDLRLNMKLLFEMTSATIEDGESTPLQEGHVKNATNTKYKYTSSAIVRALMVGATVVGALLF